MSPLSLLVPPSLGRQAVRCVLCSQRWTVEGTHADGLRELRGHVAWHHGVVAEWRAQGLPAVPVVATAAQLAEQAAVDRAWADRRRPVEAAA